MRDANTKRVATRGPHAHAGIHPRTRGKKATQKAVHACRVNARTPFNEEVKAADGTVKDGQFGGRHARVRFHTDIAWYVRIKCRARVNALFHSNETHLGTSRRLEVIQAKEVDRVIHAGPVGVESAHQSRVAVKGQRTRDFRLCRVKVTAPA